MIVFVAWLAIVCCTTHGYPQGGRKSPVTKRSDYSMYDNQFFKVGDTALDNEVTDCALIRHQYARGYIRLREFLERMEGCGIKGKMKNIAGIAAATKDAVDLPSDDTPSTQDTATTTAPFKPRPIANVIENTHRQTPQVVAYHKQGPKQQPIVNQQGIQKSQTLSSFGFFAQENRPLSYAPNPAASALQTSLTRKIISRKNMDIPQAQALQNLSGAKSKKWPNPQRYYSDQANAMAQAYAAPAVSVGQPLAKPNPFPMAFHQQVEVTSATPKEAFQPAVDPDINMDKSPVKTAQPILQKVKVKSGKMRDDINGDEVVDEGVQDEANEATIDNEESDPLPSEASFTYNPNLEEEDSAQAADATAQAEDVAGHNLPNHPGIPSPLNNVPKEHLANQDNIAAVETIPNSVKTNPKVTKPQPSTKQDLTSSGKTAKPQNIQPATDAKVQTPQKQKQALPDTPSRPVKGDDLSGGSESKLDEFLKPASTTSDAEDKSESDKAQPKTEEAAPKKKPSGLAINLDVLKNRISSSRDVGFLKRMLGLIKKITHHKDFDKLGGVQKNAIVEAGRAVHNAVAENGGNVDERSSIQQRPVGWTPGQYTPQGFYAPSYASSAQQIAVQRSFIQQNPPTWKPGDYTAYSYPGYQASYQYNPPHWKPGDYTAGSGAAGAQLAQPVKTQIKKKFHIERNSYHSQHPVSYKPPYNSLQTLNFGLYNGNTP